MTQELRKSREREVVLLEVVPPRRQRFLLQHLMVLVLCSGIAIWLLILSVQYLGLVSIVLFLFLAVALAIGGVVIAVRGFWTQRDAVLRALAIAADRGMPLASALRAIGDQCGFFLRPRVLAIGDTLEAGAPLPAALDMTPGVLARDAEMVVRVGYESGVLPAALREAVDARTSAPAAWVWIAGRMAYLMGVILVLETIVGFISYFIVPKFEAIFNDFGAPLPHLTILVIHATHMMTAYGLITLVVLLIQLALPVLVLIALLGWLNVPIPLLDRLLVRRHSALILRALVPVIEAGEPLTRAFGTLAFRYPGAWVRERLRMTGIDIDRGEDWSVALFKNGLLRESEVVVFDAARRAGNLPWAIRQTAETLERRLTYRFQAWLQLAFPVLVFAVGAMVFAVAIAYFAPLVSLIERLAR